MQARRGTTIRAANLSLELPATVTAQREMLADFTKLLARQMAAGDVPPPEQGSASQAVETLAPRVKQTLERLLSGDSEKQIAIHLGISRHTVHCYIKTLHTRFGVASRGELLARFVTRRSPE